MEESHSRFRRFPETRWSLVVRASTDGHPGRSQALAELCAAYWPPVYAYFRCMGRSSHDAEDLTQGLFAKLLEKNSLAGTDPERGKLRSYLLTAARHHLASDSRHARRMKRGGGSLHVAFDFADAEARCVLQQPADHLSPDRIYDRQWATTLLEAVIEKVGGAYQRRGQSALFEGLRPFLMSGDAAEPSTIARALGLSDAALRVAIHRLRQRYGEALREAVADTLGEGEDPEAELRYLMASFD